MGEKRGGYCTPKRCCAIFCCLIIFAITGVLVWYFVYFKSEEEAIATCGDCFCIAGADGLCPSEQPKRNYTTDLVDLYWKQQTTTNPYELSCDPFSTPDCATNPVQDQTLLDLDETAVCAIHSVTTIDVDCPEQGSYTLKSYESREAALAAGGFVTHLGHCGVCSTLQDLAVYMKFPGLATEGKFCSSKNTISIEGGAACYQNLGMTAPCAKIWAEAEFNTATECWNECFIQDILQNEPNNGPFPECKLNDCLQCDAEKSADMLKKFAGRTMRRSGLLSPVARTCDEFAFISHDRCPQTTPL